MARTKTEQFRLNQGSFEEVIGNPYAHPEPIVGHYVVLNTKSTIRTVGDSIGLGQATLNSARPSPTDFIVDVEQAVRLGLVRYTRGDKKAAAKLLQIFIATYITEEGVEIFDSRERRDIEQIIGRLLMERHISPVARYFRTIRRPIPK